jgi:hypothetical protein
MRLDRSCRRVKERKDRGGRRKGRGLVTMKGKEFAKIHETK